MTSATAPSWTESFASATVEAMTAYDAVVPIMFTPWAQALLDDVGVSRGDRVLDVATGPGTVARLAATRAGPQGHVLACDLSPAMLALARSKPAIAGAAPIAYVECAADALDVADGAVDVVVCQQGLQFFADKLAALREMRRVMRPRARIAASTWCDIAHCPPFAALADAVGAVFGAEARDAYQSGPWSLGDPDELRCLFSDAGFADIEVDGRALPIVFAGGPAQLLATLPSTAVAAQVAALDDRGRCDLRAAAAEALAPLRHADEVHSELTAHVVRATR